MGIITLLLPLVGQYALRVEVHQALGEGDKSVLDQGTNIIECHYSVI